jgi:hypothetical protein
MKKMLAASILFLGLILCLSGPGWAQGKTQPKEGASMPEASGAALWDYLQKESYQKNWKMWPGTKVFYPGKSPHGALLTTYVNNIALKAIQGKEGKLPDGSVVAKENYSADKKYLALTVMYKVKGFNPRADDWYWAKYAPDGKVDGEGKIEGCINCHAKKRNNDYIWTAPLK